MVAVGVAPAAREADGPSRSVIVWELFLLEKFSWEDWIFMSASLCSVRIRVTGERVHSRSYRPKLKVLEWFLRALFEYWERSKNIHPRLAFCMFRPLMVSVALV